jgi:ABC-type transporter Mla MlaB component
MCVTSVCSASSSPGLGLASEHVVDCWIGVIQETDRRLVRLAGRLSVTQVPELLEACAEVLPIELDLADLVSADAAGIEALQRLRGQGATLVSAPGYLQLKLDSHPGRPTSAPPPKRRSAEEK